MEKSRNVRWVFQRSLTSFAHGAATVPALRGHYSTVLRSFAVLHAAPTPSIKTRTFDSNAS